MWELLGKDTVYVSLLETMYCKQWQTATQIEEQD